MDKINGDNVKVGFKDIASLFVIIQKVAKQLLNDKGFSQFKISKITCDPGDICFWFDKGNETEKGFTVEIDPEDPSVINIGINLKNTAIPKKMMQLLRSKIANGMLKPDDDDFVYGKGKLDSMYHQVNLKEDQSDELYRILNKMFNDLTV